MATGSPPDPQHLRIITAARQTASRWCDQAVTRLEPLERYFLGSGDPRLAPPDVPRLATLFTGHFKSSRGPDVREVRDAFRVLKQFVDGLTQASCRIVPDDVADAEKGKGGDTYAYVIAGERIVHFAKRFFGELAPPAGQVRTGRAVVTVGERILNDAQKARVIVHEAAHARLGIAHSGGVFSFDLEACGAGHPVGSFQQAARNAYCFDLFAYCLSRS